MIKFEIKCDFNFGEFGCCKLKPLPCLGKKEDIPSSTDKRKPKKKI